MSKLNLREATKYDIETPLEESVLYKKAEALHKKILFKCTLIAAAITILCCCVAFYFYPIDFVVLRENPTCLIIFVVFGVVVGVIGLIIRKIVAVFLTEEIYLYYEAAEASYDETDATKYLSHFDYILGENRKYNKELSSIFLRSIEEAGYLSLSQYHLTLSRKKWHIDEVEKRKLALETKARLAREFPDLIGTDKPAGA